MTNELYYIVQSSIKIILVGGDNLDVINRIDSLMKERNWSDYRLSLRIRTFFVNHSKYAQAGYCSVCFHS